MYNHPRLPKKDRQDISAIHGYPTGSQSLARVPHRKPPSPAKPGRDWKGDADLTRFMRQPPYMSSASLATSKLRNTPQQSKKRAADITASSDRGGAFRSVDTRETKKARLEMGSPFGWTTNVTGSDRIAARVDGRVPGSNARNAIAIDDEDVGEVVQRAGPSTAPISGGARGNEAHTFGSSRGYGMNPGNVNMRTSELSDDELDLFSKQPSRGRASEEPVYGDAGAHFDRILPNRTPDAPDPSSQGDFFHDSLSQSLPQDEPPTDPLDLTAQKPSPVGPTSPQNGGRSPSYDGSDHDSIESFSATEQVPLRRNNRAGPSRTRPSPSLKSIPSGNTRSKVGQYDSAPSVSGLWGSSKKINDFASAARDQQSHPDAPRLKVREKMRGKDPPQMRPKSPVLLTSSSANPSNGAGVVPSESTTSSTLPSPSDSGKAPLHSRFAAPPDDQAMQKPLGATEGDPRDQVFVEYFYFGGHRFEPPSVDKWYRLSWTPHVLELHSVGGRKIAFGLFSELGRITLTEHADNPAICSIKGPSSFMEKARGFMEKAKEIFGDSAGIREEDSEEMCMKLVGTDKRFPTAWTRLSGVLKRTSKSAQLQVEYIRPSAAGGFLSDFKHRARATRLDPDSPRAPANVETVWRMGPEEPRPAFSLGKPSRPPGTPISVPTNPPRAQLPESTSSLLRNNTPPSSHVGPRQYGYSALPARETRSSARNKQSAPQMFPVFDRQKSPSPDPNDLMLVWPPEAKTGAVQITYGDYKRLEPQEFLNDTLIEFGLKLWFKNFSDQHPEVAKDVHMFNTFFYKKISNKDFAAGYESVRKWTSKVDIFEKKYIIVPINEHLHWYLAIICNPKGILRPPPPVVASAPRKSARLSGADPHARNIELPISDSSSAIREEVEVEDIAAPRDGDLTMEDAPASGPASREGTASHRVLHDEMDVDVAESVSKFDAGGPESLELGVSSQPQEDEVSAADTSILSPMTAPSSSDQTFIFTFDSLGGPHKAAVRSLSRYLQAEARDKRNVSNTTEGVGRTAKVPTQQNFCDCGLFVLHFVEKFMANPEQFMKDLLDKENPRPKEYWDRVWERDAVDDKRAVLKAKIESLAGDWREKRKVQLEEDERRNKEKQGSVALSGEDTAQGSKSDDDDDVEIVGETKRVSPRKSGRQARPDNAVRRPVTTYSRATGQQRGRLDGPPMRVTRRSSLAHTASAESSQEIVVLEGPGSIAERTKRDRRQTSRPF